MKQGRAGIKKPEVSVMVLAYNQEKYIRQALESILGQNYDFPIEILVNDDCSTDSTGEVLRKYGDKYPGLIKLHIQEKNIGAMQSFYYLLKRCEGKYIMGNAGDDFWLPGKLSMQYEYMESHPDAGMCYGKVQVRYCNGVKKAEVHGDKGGENFADILYRNPIPAVTNCRRKDLNDQYIHSVHPERKGWLMEDFPMWLWFAQNSKIHFIDREFAVYRVLGGSVSHPKNLDSKIRYAKSARDVRNYFTNGESKYAAEIERLYHHSLANAYLMHDKISEYRFHNKRSGGTVEHLKNILSFFPAGEKYLKSRLTY